MHLMVQGDSTSVYIEDYRNEYITNIAIASFSLSSSRLNYNNRHGLNAGIWASEIINISQKVLIYTNDVLLNVVYGKLSVDFTRMTKDNLRNLRAALNTHADLFDIMDTTCAHHRLHSLSATRSTCAYYFYFLVLYYRASVIGSIS